MNWLTDYFAQRTPELCLSLAAWPPRRLPYPACGTDFPRRPDHRVAGMLRNAQSHIFASDRMGA